MCWSGFRRRSSRVVWGPQYSVPSERRTPSTTFLLLYVTRREVTGEKTVYQEKRRHLHIFFSVTLWRLFLFPDSLVGEPRWFPGGGLRTYSCEFFILNFTHFRTCLLGRRLSEVKRELHINSTQTIKGRSPILRVGPLSPVRHTTSSYLLSEPLPGRPDGE